MKEPVIRIGIGLKCAIECKQGVEHGRDISETGLEMMTGSMKDFFQTTNRRDERQCGFNQHALVPGARWAELEIGRNTIGVLEPDIRQNDGLVFIGNNHRQKTLSATLAVFQSQAIT